MLKLMPDVHGEKTYPIWGYAWSESYISAKAGKEKQDRILQIFDYLLSDEGAFFAAYGPEGDLYEVVDDRVVLHDADVAVAAKYPSCALLSILVRWDPSLYDDRFPSLVPESYVRVNQELVEEARHIARVTSLIHMCTGSRLSMGSTALVLQSVCSSQESDCC